MNKEIKEMNLKEQSRFIEGCDIYKICNKEILLNILTGGAEEC